MSIDKSTLIIFDKAQERPDLTSAFKHFSQDYSEIPIIATGSMVRIKIQRETRGRAQEHFLFPAGEIEQITPFPMSFDEFLRNASSKLLSAIETAYENALSLPPQIHAMDMDYIQVSSGRRNVGSGKRVC